MRLRIRIGWTSFAESTRTLAKRRSEPGSNMPWPSGFCWLHSSSNSDTWCLSSFTGFLDPRTLPLGSQHILKLPVESFVVQARIEEQPIIEATSLGPLHCPTKSILQGISLFVQRWRSGWREVLELHASLRLLT